jgi:hypothetical protein
VIQVIEQEKTPSQEGYIHNNRHFYAEVFKTKITEVLTALVMLDLYQAYIINDNFENI